ncbi:uncharacterized protein LOC113294596 [Papaver somniferum]|uniref:uncharacterized protein LOC113294596 n=1 Tax=Papaver somniferum TaxID=3469 RepID=UPI000E6FFB61|nr:uncharacterized protein LOC113294596 [Papaver somniferum]
MKRKKFHIASRWPLCKQSEETLEHILWYYDYIEIIWKWLGGVFQFINPTAFEDILSAAKSKSPAVKEIWRNIAFITLKEIWFSRNRAVYEDEEYNLEMIKKRILKFTADSDIRMFAYMWNSSYDLQIINFFNLRCRKVRYLQVQECFFHLPMRNQLLMCYGGAARGNPVDSGFGFIGRDWTSDVKVAATGGLGIATNFLAEIMAVLFAGEWAVANNFLDLCFRTDSSAAISAFRNGKLPWIAITRWKKIYSRINWEFIHNFREVNFSADSLAKKRAGMNKGECVVFTRIPPFLKKIEIPFLRYYRFC